MKLSMQKRLASDVSNVSSKRVKFDPNRLEDIREAITKKDIRDLIEEGAIEILPKRGVSRVRARKRQVQKRSGRRRGHGTRKGSHNARLSSKRRWINSVRLQRSFIKELRDKKKISNEFFTELSLKIKGGFFRSKRHLKLYLTEHK
ncbi:50S ribosomal protein L19e [Candidatus Woesearchaeota archaeon]|nr:50S ribosomal protein L19e [Candidatus Woesearchaeota archaeon]